jgi:diaminopimelate decarboxylase
MSTTTAGAGPARPPGPGGVRAGVFFAGNLCLERDMITNHLTFVDRLPGPGNIVAFVNTAAYQMDLSASAALMHPRPGRAVVRADAAGGWAVHADHEEAGACSTSTSPS